MGKGEIIIYKSNKGKDSVEVKLDKETVWLSLNQIAELFNRDKSVISKHLRNIFITKELDRNSVVANFATTAADGKQYQVDYYNLDGILSVGYRVNSKEGTKFRIWATNVLKKYLIDGYAINEKKLKFEVEKYKELQKSIKLLENVINIKELPEEAKGIISVITEYTQALNLLDDYDHQRLSLPKTNSKELFRLTYEEAKIIIESMKEKFKDSNLVGKEKDKSFRSSINAIYQTFDRKELYPTLEEKAAHLLYFATKNHSFVDGNKRIAAALFVYFLEKNKLLHSKDGFKRLENNTLVALILMIAQSNPKEKDTMIKVIVNLIK